MLSTCREAFTPTKLIYCLAIPVRERFVRDRISDVHALPSSRVVLLFRSGRCNKYKLARLLPEDCHSLIYPINFRFLLGKSYGNDITSAIYRCIVIARNIFSKIALTRKFQTWRWSFENKIISSIDFNSSQSQRNFIFSFYIYIYSFKETKIRTNVFKRAAYSQLTF